jgi:hypothetical protein
MRRRVLRAPPGIKPGREKILPFPARREGEDRFERRELGVHEEVDHDEDGQRNPEKPREKVRHPSLHPLKPPWAASRPGSRPGLVLFNA